VSKHIAKLCGDVDNVMRNIFPAPNVRNPSFPDGPTLPWSLEAELDCAGG
jgi:hypothetical protein